MSDPSGLFADSAIGKLLELIGAFSRRATFTWRVARRARDAAAEDGYSVSLKELRLITREKVVKAAVKSQRTADVIEAEKLLERVVAKKTGTTRLTAHELFLLLRRGYLGAAEQVDRDLAIHDETTARFNELTTAGSSRDAIWRANLNQISPPFASDAQLLRELYGDGIDRLLHELVHSRDRAVSLQSWAISRPSWLPDSGSTFGWLGEIAFESDAPDTALLWFDAAIQAGAEPHAYWLVRRVYVDSSLSNQDKIESLHLVATHPLVLAILPETREFQLKNIRLWSPQSAVQQSFRASLITQFLVELLEFDEAIEVGRRAFTENSFYGAGVHAVEAYLRRSGYRAGNQAQDVDAAFTLAIQIRDKRRNWGVSSGAATAKAMRAAMMLTDPDRAVALAYAPQATSAESAHVDVRGEAAIALTLLGDVPGAKKLINERTPPWIRLQVESREAELLDDGNLANSLLSEAINATDDWSEKARLCFRLATRGLVHPFVELLREQNASIAEELELIAGLNSRQIGAEERARARVLARPGLAFPLFSYFEATNRRKDIIFVAEQVAQEWSDPEMWLKAALTLLLEKEYAKASDRAAKALDVGGDSWGNRAGAYMVQIESATASGDWASALVSARALVRLRPNSDSARWVLVRVQRTSGDLDSAYVDWKSGERPRPTIEIEASLWLEFFRQHGSDMATLHEFFEVVNEFSQYKQVRNLALGALTFAPLSEDAGDLNLNSLLEQFENEYPDEKHAMWKVSIDLDDPSSILEKLEEVMGPQREHLVVLDEHVRNGTLPIGFAARFAGKNVAELLGIRHKSPRFAGSLNPDDQFEAVELALTSGVAADVTALFTLSLLNEPHGNLLMARFPRVVATSEQMLDANATRETFRRATGGVFYPSSATRDAWFQEDDPIERTVQNRNADRLMALFRRTERLSALPFSSEIARRLSDGADVWPATLDLAARMKIPIWCDDNATRVVAAEAGAHTFGTPALIEYLRQSEQLSGEVADNIDADLIHNWTVGIVYRDSVYVKAGALDQLTPQGLAAAITYGGSEHALDKVNFVVSAMGAMTVTPDQLAGWAVVAFRYVGDIAGSTDAAFDNHVKLLHGLLVQPWMNPSTLLFILKAGREEVTSQWAGVFQAAFRQMFLRIADQTDRSTAGSFALALSAELEPTERQLALEVILAR